MSGLFFSYETVVLMLELGVNGPKGAELVRLLTADFEASLARQRHAPTRQAPSDDRVWVYVMGVDHPGDNLVKVGISQHPQHRRETLQKERGLTLFVAHTEGPFTRPDALAIEREAHARLTEHREQGEWFLCGTEQAIDAVRVCARVVAQ